MKLLHKLFFEQKMTWKKAIIFAILSAILAAAVLQLPGIRSTSISYIGVTLDCWILFALIIIMNCKKPLEAGLKTFVFFLISQPLIYLMQIPFIENGWQNFIFNYPRWAVWTVLCFPGAMIAWFVKKGKWYSALILSVATGFLACVCIYYLRNCLRNFPHELAAMLFCAALAVVLILALLKNRTNRLIAGAITLLVAVVTAVMLFCFSSAPMMSADFNGLLDKDHTWQVVSQEGNVGTVTVEDDGCTLDVSATAYGEQEVTVENENGETVTLILTYDKSGSMELNPK